MSFLSASGEAGGNPFKAAENDNRVAPRQRVLLGALIVDPDFNRVIACRVDNVSESGARLRAPECFILPREFWLIAQKAGLAYKATTVWRRFPHAGLSLGEPMDLEAPITDVHRRLRAVWRGLTQ